MGIVIVIAGIAIIAIIVLAVKQHKLNARISELDRILVHYVSKILEPRIQSIADTHDRFVDYVDAFVDYVDENVVFKKSTKEKVEKKKSKRGRPKKASK